MADFTFFLSVGWVGAKRHHFSIGLKTLTTRIVYKIRGSSFSSKNLNLEWIKNEHRSNPFLYTILVVCSSL